MFKKIALGILIFLILIVGFVVAAPFLFKDKINAMIKEQINKELLADVEYGDYSLSLIKSFPDFYFTLEDLSVVGQSPFEGDTLAKVQQLGFSLELMKLIKSEELLIHELDLQSPQVIIYKLLNEEGDTLNNYDILPSSGTETDTSSSLIDIKINQLNITDGKFFYDDFTNETEIVINNIDLKSTLSYVGEQVETKNDFKIDELSFLSEGVAYLNRIQTKASIDVIADLANNHYQIQENEIQLNDLKLYADGFVQLLENDAIDMDLSFAADKSSFKDLLSLIPAKYLSDFETLKADGLFNLNGNAKGIMLGEQTPAFSVDLAIENGQISYPDLPSSIDDINLKATIQNSTSSLDYTAISVPKATFNFAGEPVELSLNAKQILLDPAIDLSAKGKIDLAKIPEIMPIEGVNAIKGIVDADISFEGLMSDVENENYQSIDFTGDLMVDNFELSSKDLPNDLSIKEMSLQFSPQKASLIANEAQIGESDFNIDGNIENIIPYVFADADLKGDVTIVSKLINLDELMISENESSENQESSATKVPEKMNLSASLLANQVKYDGLDLNNVKGFVNIQDEKLSLNNLQANLLGGFANINGVYDTKDKEKPLLDFNWDIQKFDIQESFNYLNTVQAIAPIAQFLSGSFSSNMALSSLLNDDLSLDLSMLSGLGEIRIPYASFKEFPIFQKVSDATKLPAFNQPALNDAWTVLKFEDGRVAVEPFEIKMKDMTMKMQGTNGFDQSIDYQIELAVPSDKFGGAAQLANDFLAKQKIPLLNFSVPQTIHFHLNVGGTMKQPSVSIARVSADNSDKGVKEQIKENIVNQVNDAKEEIKDKAKEEVDKAKDNFLDTVDDAKEDLKENAKEEADKVKENVKENIKDKLKDFGW